MQNISLLPAVLAFALSVAMGPVLIPVLKKLRVGQTVREDGPGTHLKKNGTPTMGGIIIVGAMILTGLLFVKRYPKIMPILFLTAGFGMVGLLDDYLKVVLRRSMGLSPGAKFLLQLLVTALYAVYLSRYADSAFLLKIPFSDRQIELGVFNVPFLFFVTTATVNGTNFTDGLDGLATGVTLIVTVFFSVAAIGMQSGIEPVTGAGAGALLGFLLFNVYPASVFMGDTGSLALGGFVVSVSYALHMPLFIPPCGTGVFSGSSIGHCPGGLF